MTGTNKLNRTRALPTLAALCVAVACAALCCTFAHGAYIAYAEETGSGNDQEAELQSNEIVYGDYTYTEDSSGAVTIVKYNGTAANVEVPATLGYNGRMVLCIDDKAFMGNLNLQSITFPDTLQEICYRAFEGCTNLRSVKLPRDLTRLENLAFNGCVSLESIGMDCTKLNDMTAYIPQPFKNAGKNTDGITVTYGSNCTYVPSSMFNAEDESSKPKITQVIMQGSNITTIGNGAFEDCPLLASFDFPETLEKIESEAFKGCTSLTSVTFPEKLAKIENHAFEGCTSISNIRINCKKLGDFSSYSPAPFKNAGKNTAGIHVVYGSTCQYVPSRMFNSETESTYPNVKTVTFEGNAPEFSSHAFSCCTITAYYPAARSSWTADVLQQYDGTVTWVANGTPVYQGTELAGDGRYQTAQKIALTAYPNGAAGVIVATGENFPDALGASALAGLLDYPVVLTSSRTLSTEAADTIAALKATDIIVVGGTSAVDSAVENALKAYGTVTRLSGANRFATADRIYAYGMECGKTWGTTAIVATGNGYADALSVSGYAFAKKTPIFLADASNGLSAASTSALGSGAFTRVIVVGGTSVVNSETETQLAGKVSSVRRISGDDRYATSLAIAQFVLEEGGTMDGACVATGTNYPDALAGSALAGKGASAILLANSGKTNALDALSEGSAVKTLYFLGGTSALPQDVRDAALQKAGL